MRRLGRCTLVFPLTSRCSRSKYYAVLVESTWSLLRSWLRPRGARFRRSANVRIALHFLVVDDQPVHVADH